jgi:hypothetical protein
VGLFCVLAMTGLYLMAIGNFYEIIFTCIPRLQ